MARRKRAIRLLLGVAVSLTALYLSVVGIDYGSVWANLTQANLPILGLAMASVAINNIAKAWRWKLLLGERGVVVSLWRLLHLHLVGQMLNQLLPARAGDFSRVYLAGDLGVARAFVLGTLAIEKTIDMLCYVLIGLLLLLLMPLPDWVSQPAYLLTLTTAVALAGLVLAALYRQRLSHLPGWLAGRLPAHLRDRAEQMIGDGLASLHVLAGSHSAVRITFMTGMIWITAVLTNYLVLRALNVAAPPIASVLVLFVLVAGITISSVPGQIGVFEYLCVLSLALFGVDQASALSFGVVLHILVFLPPVIAGITSLWGFGPGTHILRGGVGGSSQT